MIKADVIKANKRLYKQIEAAIEKMVPGLEKDVAQYYTLKWAKGKKWEGGLSDREAQYAYYRLIKMGYDADAVYEECSRQLDFWSEQLPWWI